MGSYFRTANAEDADNSEGRRRKNQKRALLFPALSGFFALVCVRRWIKEPIKSVTSFAVGFPRRVSRAGGSQYLHFRSSMPPRAPAPPAALIPLYGHAALQTQLRAAAARGALPASLLFHGPRGIGKQRLALWLWQLLLCANADPAPGHRSKPCPVTAPPTPPD